MGCGSVCGLVHCLQSRVTVDGDGKIRASYTPNNLKAHGELVSHWTGLMKSMGYTIVITQKMDITVAMHQCGTARFGEDPKTSYSTSTVRPGTSTIFMSSMRPSCHLRPL